MSVFCVDASVVVGFLLRSSRGSEQCIEKLLPEVERGEISLIAPSFFLQEVSNALRFSLTNSADAFLAQMSFQNLPIQMIHLEPFQQASILSTAYALDTAVYDCAYHYLAVLKNGIFLTADKKYYKKAQHLGSIQLV